MGLQMREFDYTMHTDNVGTEWKKWVCSFETMIRASRISDDEWKQDLLLQYAGSKVQMLVATLPELTSNAWTVGKCRAIRTAHEETVAKLNAFFLPKANTTYERHVLRQMKQKADENIDMFTIRLRMQAERWALDRNSKKMSKTELFRIADQLRYAEICSMEVMLVSRKFCEWQKYSKQLPNKKNYLV